MNKAQKHYDEWKADHPQYANNPEVLKMMADLLSWIWHGPVVQ